jgi:flagellar FliJ protein
MFHFKMQTILDVRKTIEEKLISEFCEHQKELQRVTKNLQTLQLRISELTDDLRNVQGQKLPVAEIVMQAAHIKRHRNEADIQKETVRSVATIVDRKRNELIEASRKRKTMEICKERHLNKYRAEKNTLERTTIDELVIVKHNRGKTE